MTNVYDSKGNIVHANISRKSKDIGGKPHISYKGNMHPLENKEGASSSHITLKEDINSEANKAKRRQHSANQDATVHQLKKEYREEGGESREHHIKEHEHPYWDKK